MVFAGILAAGMSVERQLEAAQKFLRGIRSPGINRRCGCAESTGQSVVLRGSSSGCVAGTGAARLLG